MNKLAAPANMNEALPRTALEFARARDWAINRALPLWATAGRDRNRGGFHERLTLDGVPITNVPKRAMVQARQIYVFSQAHLLGWIDGKELVADAVECLITQYRAADGAPGFVHSLAPDGGVANSTRDTYAHAFILFALGWYHRLSGDTQVIAQADQILAFLDENAASPRGGFLDAVPVIGHGRSQNPHMHLFEAMIALHGATGAPRFLARGAEIFGLFTSRFFDSETGSLVEHCDQGLVPLSGKRGALREPGHHYEWVWLLRNFQQMSGRDVSRFAEALYSHADRHGWDEEGFVVDEVYSDGRPARASRRFWPHTECIKANLVEAERGRSGADNRAAEAFRKVLDVFLVDCHPGGWREQFDPQGRPRVDFMPASSFYHIFCAIAEGERILGT